MPKYYGPLIENVNLDKMIFSFNNVVEDDSLYEHKVLVYVNLVDSNGSIYKTESKIFPIQQTSNKLTTKQIIESVSTSFVQNKLKTIAKQIQQHYADYYDSELDE